jgi:hypothetical protein
MHVFALGMVSVLHARSLAVSGEFAATTGDAGKIDRA